MQLDVHLVIDNYATHKHAAVRAWLAARPRYHVHFTPTYASSLNQVEPWFGHITQRAIRRGSFRTVRELVRRIDAFVTHHNAGARPFAWTATADSVLTELQRLLQAISGTGREAPAAAGHRPRPHAGRRAEGDLDRDPPGDRSPGISCALTLQGRTPRAAAFPRRMKRRISRCVSGENARRVDSGRRCGGTPPSRSRAVRIT